MYNHGIMFRNVFWLSSAYWTWVMRPWVGCGTWSRLPVVSNDGRAWFFRAAHGIFYILVRWTPLFCTLLDVMCHTHWVLLQYHVLTWSYMPGTPILMVNLQIRYHAFVLHVTHHLLNHLQWFRNGSAGFGELHHWLRLILITGVFHTEASEESAVHFDEEIEFVSHLWLLVTCSYLWVGQALVLHFWIFLIGLGHKQLDHMRRIPTLWCSWRVCCEDVGSNCVREGWINFFAPQDLAFGVEHLNRFQRFSAYIWFAS